MAHHYPTPGQIGLKIPPYLIADRFSAGFNHGLKGGQLDHVEYFRRSFRLGFRAAKLYLREVRRQQGILQFPARFRYRLTSRWDR
ncbi:MAG: hypothetical protein ACJ8J7_12530 [Sulfurifustaceae bacterium]